MVDLGVTDATAEEIQTEGLSLDELIARGERALKVMDGIDASKFTSKEGEEIKINLGKFSVTKPALEYAHHIAGPSL